MTHASRRALLAGGLCAALFPPALRAAPTGFAIDWQGGERPPEIVAAVAAQVRLIEDLTIAPAIIAFFARQPIAIDLMPGGMSRIGANGVAFERRAVEPDNPILLHELLHLYHLQRLPNGYDNADIRGFYREAKDSGRYPPKAYMLSDPIEFFAMTASTILHGRQPRPPFSRAEVREKSPKLYRWIAAEFALRA